MANARRNIVALLLLLCRFLISLPWVPFTRNAPPPPQTRLVDKYRLATALGPAVLAVLSAVPWKIRTRPVDDLRGERRGICFCRRLAFGVWKLLGLISSQTFMPFRSSESSLGGSEHSRFQTGLEENVAICIFRSNALNSARP